MGTVIIEEYVPDGPCIVQSGKNKGLAYEQMMFTDYDSVKWLEGTLSRDDEHSWSKGRVHKHLEWLLTRGEEVKPLVACPHCGKHPISFFYLDKEGHVERKQTACFSNECKLQANPGGTLRELPFKFSSLAGIVGRSRGLKELFQTAFAVDKLTAQAAYRVFK